MRKELKTLLEANGLEGYEQLRPDEKVKYQEWERILSAPDIRPDDIKKHLSEKLAKLREEREEDTKTIPGERLDTERLIAIRIIKGMLGIYTKAEAARKKVEGDIAKSLDIIKKKKK